jgi:two-component system, cell cycle sensor histidine kinase and response regulator CckA
LTGPLRVLLVAAGTEDERCIAEALADEATGASELVTAADAAAGAEAVDGVRPDVILLDLGESPGEGLGRFARMQLAAGPIPVVVLAGAEHEPTALRAVRAGAADYLLKDQLHATLIRRSLHHAVQHRRATAAAAFTAQLLNHVGQAVIAADLEGRILHWNPAAERLYGWPAAEVMGRVAPELMVSPESLDLARSIIADVAAGRSSTHELRLRRRDGSTFVGEVSNSPLRDGTGAVVGVIGVSADVTRRRAADRALRASEQKLRLFFEQLPTLSWTTDTDLRITSMIGSVLDRIELSPAEVVGVPMLAIIPDEPGVERMRAALDGESVAYVREYAGRWFDVQVQPLRDDAGDVIGTIGIALDITERRAAEQRELESHEQLRAIVHSSPLAIIAYDDANRITMWNDAAKRIFGWSAEEVVGTSMPTFPADDGESLTALGDAMRAGVSRISVEGRRRTRSGGLVDVAIECAPLFHETGEYRGYMALLMDITDRKAAEARHRRLTEVLEASPDYVATFDARHRALYMNRAGRAMVGVDEHDEIEGLPLARFHTATAGAALLGEALPRAIEHGTWSGESELRGVGEAVVPIWTTVVAHRDDDGKLTFFSVVGHDLTERRRLEEQFREAQKMEVVGRLAGGVAHDFNNLLTAIGGSAELLLERLGGDPAIRPELDEVLRSVDRASTLTRQLLAFSRRQVLQTTLLDVNVVARAAGEMLRRLVGPGYTLVMDLQSPLPPVRADRAQLEQVMLHLVTNARDAMPVGGRIELRSALRRVAADEGYGLSGVAAGDYVELVVADEGTGMEPSVLSRIFEPFFTTRQQGGGTGLGLPTVHGIVTQSGGHVMVESSPGQGSTFHVLLPAAAAAADQTAAAEATGENGAQDERPDAADADAGSHGLETILLVEDEAAVRRLGVRILERRGYNVVAAGSADDALRVFPDIADSVALLVTDIIMPGLNGIELARRLQFMKPGLRVLFTSGYTADAMSGETVLPAGTAFLEKPFTPRSLAVTVRELLDQAMEPD